MLVSCNHSRSQKVCGVRKEKIIQKEIIKYKERGDGTMKKDVAECA
jgi:hypothetical protein